MRRILYRFGTLAAVAIGAALVAGCNSAGAGGGGGGSSAAMDGSVTVTFSGFIVDGNDLVALALAEGDQPGGAAPILGVGVDVTSGGAASAELRLPDSGDNPTSTTWIATAGTTYDLYIYLDMDGDRIPSIGDYYHETFMPSVRFTVDGNMAIATDLSEYTQL